MYTCQCCKSWKFKEDDGKTEMPEDSGLYLCNKCYEEGSDEHVCDYHCECRYFDVEQRSLK